MSPFRISAFQSRTYQAAVILTVGLLTVSATQSMAEDKKPEKPASFYDPVERQIEGWTIAVDPLLLNDENKEAGKAI